MGITNRERQIIELDERGLKTAEIAQRLGVSPAYADRIVQQLCRGLGRNTQFDAMIALGSKRLLKAIQNARAA